MIRKNARTRTTPATNTFHMTVWPAKSVSHAGISRSAPSRKPTYQSGCDVLEEMAGSYGPNSQIGLIWAIAPKTARTPNTKKNSAAVLAMKTG
jgi:hypothetical protein